MFWLLVGCLVMLLLCLILHYDQHFRFILCYKRNTNLFMINNNNKNNKIIPRTPSVNDLVIKSNGRITPHSLFKAAAMDSFRGLNNVCF